ncbi:pilus assembly protein N-terminal domain-containing protein [Sphingomonas sp. J315]|uniref:pilus assembly protein N-terminal domain-containing protein n=1 Tax=Sphingomonas sp. J315 TaxID=2898433 RepID=UPI002899A419|nr:pilus assembly protein N-terminal domain-containing protein [Sphingomonas sp. J315]
MSDIFVADSNVADVQVRSPTQLWVFGKKVGETTVYATTKAGKVIYSTTVRVGNNFDSVQGMLDTAMPDSNITATTMNGFVLLTGTVAAPQDAAEAERLAQAFVGEETKILSRLKTSTPLQVNLQVRISEVSRSFAKNIGSNFTTLDGSGGFKFGIGSGRQPATSWTTDPNLPLGVGGERSVATRSTRSRARSPSVRAPQSRLGRAEPRSAVLAGCSASTFSARSTLAKPMARSRRSPTRT